MQDKISKRMHDLGEYQVIGLKSVEWYGVNNPMATGGYFTGLHLDRIDFDQTITKKEFPDGTFCYYTDDWRARHCPFGPATLYKDGTPLWYIKGRLLTDEEVEVIKTILSDVKLAPLYINHLVYKYTAMWVLRNNSSCKTK